MARLYKITDGKKVLGNAIWGQDVGSILKMIQEGTFWAYRGYTKKHLNAIKTLMTREEKRAISIFD